MKRNCPSVTDFPLDLGSSGFFMTDDFLFVCGGSDPAYLDDQCYLYNRTSNTWNEKAKLNIGRKNAAAIKYDSEHWWITGGYTEDGCTKSTELYHINNNSFTYHMDLPTLRDLHSLVRINSTHIMLVGNAKSTNQTWMFNQDTEEWIELPNTIEARKITQAGLVTFQNGSQIVILAAGQGTWTAEYFDLEQQVWSSNLPDLPISLELYSGSTVQYENTFLIAGGWDSGNEYYQKTIIKFDPEIADWVYLDEELKEARTLFPSFLLPEYYFDCT